MRFAIGEKYKGRNNPGYIAEILQLDDDGRKGWADVKDRDGKHVSRDWVVYAQFIQNWTLIDSGDAV